MEACNLCQIGKGSAYSHYFGYLRLMHGEHGIRERLEQFKNQNSAGLSREVLDKFYSEAVVVLAPDDGVYPPRLHYLKGVGNEEADVKPFKLTVGGNNREYGKFPVHEVTSSGNNTKRYVALDKVGALATLQKLHQHGPTGLSDTDCKNQRKEMMEELEKIAADNPDLCGQLKIVKYSPGEHVGDAILSAI